MDNQTKSKEINTIGFSGNIIRHRVMAEFVPTTLPEAEKPYNLRVKYQQLLDIDAVAAMAVMCGIKISPEEIVAGTNAYFHVARFLASNGFKIKNPMCTAKISIQGQYDGTETHLPEGIVPKFLIHPSADWRNYGAEHIEVQITGKGEKNGFIASIVDKMTGETDTVLTLGGLISIHGVGLKIAFDMAHANTNGLLLQQVNTDTCYPILPEYIAVNEPRLITAVLSTSVQPGEYYVIVRTQSALSGGGRLLKEVREMKSDSTITINTSTKSAETEPTEGQPSPR